MYHKYIVDCTDVVKILTRYSEFLSYEISQIFAVTLVTVIAS